jgi:hypothetical protein
MFKQWQFYLGLSAVASVAVPVAAQEAGTYSEDLARVYGAHQRILALKEACDEAVPAQRKSHDKAYGEWKKRHNALLQDLERRVTLMIRKASKDQQDYTRNLGKYEGAILQQRLDYKKDLLSLDKAEMGQQCAQMSAYLQGAEADFSKKYAEELQTIGKRR